DAGSRWNHHGDINLAFSNILAQVGSGVTSALVVMNATGDINLAYATINALNTFGPASVYLNAGHDINAFLSTINAKTIFGNATVDLDAGDDINLTFSNILAQTVFGKARVALDARDDINLLFSNLTSKVFAYGHAEVTLDAGSRWNHHGDINLAFSNILAQVGSGVTSALVVMNATGDINLFASNIEAKVIGYGTALVSLLAGNTIYIGANSTVSADAGSGYAGVIGLAGGDILAYGKVSAVTSPLAYGYALVALLAGNDIYAADVSASGGNVDAIQLIASLVSNYFFGGSPIYVGYLGSVESYSSAVLLGSLDGDITMGNVSADLVAAVTLGLDGNSSIKDADGIVKAKYLILVARNNIGESLLPITTDVKTLSAFSWDRGDIYISELNDIILGLYLPIFLGSPDNQVLALGFSVAANNGIIHIISDGDMIINSVVSPRGGVFLQSTNGSIYAGFGWCPAVSQEDLDALFDHLGTGSFRYFAQYIAEEFLMDLTGTPWNTVPGFDYFSAIMVGLPNLAPGPNVIAGGYSYIGAPKGTIGVGTPASVTTYNPLKINIQALNGGVNSAVPSYMIPVGETLPLAGLTIEMGGSSASKGYTIDTLDGNGPLGISGMFEGIVRPGTTAVTGVQPSPYIYNTNSDPASLNPPGYVFYNDSDLNCVSPLDGSKADNNGIKQIWPKGITKSTGAPNNITGLLLDIKYIWPVQEILVITRGVTPLDMATSADFNGGVLHYQPLTPLDTAAFDSVFNLGEDAYKFLDGGLNITGHDGLLPILEGIKKKKKGTSI
ncbi:MAG: hypothetical protein WC723_07015, partial [Candidatus Omnitrophota bacterium]